MQRKGPIGGSAAGQRGDVFWMVLSDRHSLDEGPGQRYRKQDEDDRNGDGLEGLARHAHPPEVGGRAAFATGYRFIAWILVRFPGSSLFAPTRILRLDRTVPLALYSLTAFILHYPWISALALQP
jgi:hypothetical protein